MSPTVRYLTPSKFGLLVTLSLYVESLVPTITTIPFLRFLISHLPSDKPAEYAGARHNVGLVLTVEDFEKALNKHASVIPGRTLWDLFLKKLWAITDLHSFHAVFEYLETLVAKTREETLLDIESGIPEPTDRVILSRQSPCGVFIRRTQLEFSKLRLDESISLFESFMGFRQPTFQEWQKKNPTGTQVHWDQEYLDEFTAHVEDTDLIIGPDAKNQASEDDVRVWTEFQIFQMQKLGQRVPMDMKEKLEELLQTEVTTSSLAHYLRFLEAWKAGDYSTAFESLHRYFDYSMDTNKDALYQYALLNMALLHAELEHFTEAVTAIREAIAVARESDDMDCLNFCISWLYLFEKSHPEEVEKDSFVDQRSTLLDASAEEALVLIKATAEKGQMWSLLSTAIVAEARLILEKGDQSSHDPENRAEVGTKSVVEHAFDSGFENSVENGPNGFDASNVNSTVYNGVEVVKIGESVRSAFECLSEIAELNFWRDIKVAYGQQLLLEAAIYSRLGSDFMQSSRVDIFQICYAKFSCLEDRLEFTAREAKGLSQKGQYDEALELMNSVEDKTLRVLKYQHAWMVRVSMLKAQHSLYRKNPDAVRHLLSQAKANSTSDPATEIAIQRLEIELSIRQGKYSAAMDQLTELYSSDTVTHGDHREKLSLLVLKARILDKAGRPEKGFRTLMEVMHKAHDSLILDVYCDAANSMARVLLSLNEYSGVLRLYSMFMPQLLECGDGAMTASAFMSMADAMIGLAGQAAEGSVARKEYLADAFNQLFKATDTFSSLGDVRGQLQAIAKAGAVKHAQGDFVLANDYATTYLGIRKAAAAEAKASSTPLVQEVETDGDEQEQGVLLT